LVKKQLRIFLAGVMVVAPLAVTAYVVWAAGAWLERLGDALFEAVGIPLSPWTGVGTLVLLGAIYCVGLLTHFWLFRNMLRWLEMLVVRLPVVKTVYESVRDLMKLFGGDARKMGRAVLYKVPGAGMTVLGILTNDQPGKVNEAAGEKRVAVFLPFSYMLGGPTIFVSPDDVLEVDLTVDQALKLCTTASVSAERLVEAGRESERPAKA